MTESLSRPQNQLVWGHRRVEEPGGLEEPREANDAEERGREETREQPGLDGARPISHGKGYGGYRSFSHPLLGF